MKPSSRCFVGAFAFLLLGAAATARPRPGSVNPLDPNPLKAPIWPFASTSPGTCR